MWYLGDMRFVFLNALLYTLDFHAIVIILYKQYFFTIFEARQMFK